jgi:acetyltransferase-like isoleucine patch superfamily enzyme
MPSLSSKVAGSLPVALGEMAQLRGGHLVAKARRLPSRLRRLPASIGYFRGPLLMSRLRKWWVLARNPHATIRFGKHTYLGPGFSLHMPFGGTFLVGEGVEFRRNFRAELGPNGRIEIGSGSYLTYDVIITCDTSIVIGERCGLSQGTYITDGSHKYRDLNVPFLQQGYNYRAIRIEDDAQIHAKCTIVNSIGTRSVLGANAMVTREIPPYCLAAGVPARVVDYFGPPGLEPAELSESNSERSG